MQVLISIVVRVTLPKSSTEVGTVVSIFGSIYEVPTSGRLSR